MINEVAEFLRSRGVEPEFDTKIEVSYKKLGGFIGARVSVYGSSTVSDQTRELFAGTNADYENAQIIDSFGNVPDDRAPDDRAPDDSVSDDRAPDDNFSVFLSDSAANEPDNNISDTPANESADKIEDYMVSGEDESGDESGDECVAGGMDDYIIGGDDIDESIVEYMVSDSDNEEPADEECANEEPADEEPANEEPANEECAEITDSGIIAHMIRDNETTTSCINQSEIAPDSSCDIFAEFVVRGGDEVDKSQPMDTEDVNAQLDPAFLIDNIAN